VITVLLDRARGLMRVSADGGAVEPATRLDVARGENSHRWPVFLPDGVHFLYFVRSTLDDRRGAYVGRVDRPASGSTAPLFRAESEAVYAPLPGTQVGVLFSVAEGRIEARRFDAGRLTLVGDAQTIPLSAGGNTPHHPAMLSVSTDVLTFASASIPYGDQLASNGRNEDEPRQVSERELQNWPRLSPDGRRIARQRLDPLRGSPDIWVEDLERRTLVRVTVASDGGAFPVWSPDGRRLAYAPGTLAKPHVTLAAADGTGVLRVIPCPGGHCEPTDWSPDGRFLVVNVRKSHGADVWSVPVEQGGASGPLLAEPFIERDARISPDGRWIAYVSEESGHPEVSVRNLSGPAHRIVISGGGGDQPVWHRSGTELFFVDLRGRLRSVAVRRAADGSLTLGLPMPLNVPPIGSGHWGTQYDVSPDGRVYFLNASNERPPREIGFVLTIKHSSRWRRPIRTARGTSRQQRFHPNSTVFDRIPDSAIS
jgi:dipeptidyl aminopeptidase/acylaminoacyl peptidase